MKYTHLFGAAALAVAMGTQGLALTETNTVYTQDFDGVDTSTYTLMSDLALTGWTDPTASGEDADKSFLVAAPVSVSATDGYEGYAGKHLELNTDGHELVYTPTSGVITNTTAQISMRVRLVGSESDPTGLDTDVHSAVYLKTDENDPTFAALYAYTWSAEGQTNEWVELDTTGLAGLANGAVLALRVTMDYADQEATYEGVIVTADPDADIADSAYVGLGTIDMANVDTASVSGKVLSNVAFKGTGGVDNLVIRQISSRITTATMSLKVFNGEEWEDGDTNAIDTEDTTRPFTGSITVEEGLVVRSVEVYDVTDGQTETLVATLSNTVVDENGLVEITLEDFPDVEAGKSYLVKITLGEPVVTHTVTFDLNGHGTAIPAQTVNHNGTATEPTAPTAEGWTFGGWTLNGASYDFATLVTGDITLVATWTEASSDLDEFSIGDDLPAGVDPITVDGDKFIVNVVVPQGATASLLGSSTVNGKYAPVTATVTAKDGYTELVYTMGANETAKFFKVKFSK